MTTSPKRAETSARQTAESAPLCVDLDGSLLIGDLLHELLVQYLLRNPLRLFRVLVWAALGRARLKAELGARVVFEPGLLPYNAPFLAYLMRQHALGRRLVLSTAADRRPAQVIAAHLGVFEAVFASDGDRNLKGASKAAVLSQAFPGGFVYAGDSAADLAIWRAAQGAVLVGTASRVEKAVRASMSVEASFPRPRGGPRALLKLLRPHQWGKNALVFIPILTANALLEPRGWISAALAFVGFSLAASSSYVVNDLADIWSDRAHPRKKARPFASATVSPLAGAALAPVLLVMGLVASTLAGVAPVVLVYVATSLLYSLRLKEIALVDVFVLAGLYTLRLFGGGLASGHHVSLWLLAYSSFLFFGLALAKRVTELTSVTETGQWSSKRRDYGPADVALLANMGAASSVAACVVFAMYLRDGASHYPNPDALWLILPLQFFWQARVWLLVGRGLMHDDPVVFALRDRVSWAILGLMAPIVWLAEQGWLAGALRALG